MAGSVETKTGGLEDLTLASLIVDQAKADSLAFLGLEKSIPQPPQLLLQTLENLRGQEHQLAASEAVFIPQVSFAPGNSYPGWRANLSPWYYDQFNSGQIKRGSLDLPGRWMIVDGTKRPNYSEIKEWKARSDTKETNFHGVLPSDTLSLTISQARQQEKIRITNGRPFLEWLPPTSRFGVSVVEQDEIVFPELVKALGLTVDIKSGRVEIRRPTLAEFNYLGHLPRFSHFSTSTTSEAVEDIYKGIINPKNISVGRGAPERSITSGNINFGGLSGANYLLSEDHVEAVSFRPVIIFK